MLLSEEHEKGWNHRAGCMKVCFAMQFHFILLRCPLAGTGEQGAREPNAEEPDAGELDESVGEDPIASPAAKRRYLAGAWRLSCLLGPNL